MSQEYNQGKAFDEAIKTAAEVLNYTYMHEDWSRANHEADIADADHLFIDLLPASGRFTYSNGWVKESEDRLFAFLHRCELDYKGAEIREIQHQTKADAVRFLSHLHNLGYYDGGAVRFSSIIDKLDANYAGIAVEVTLHTPFLLCTPL